MPAQTSDSGSGFSQQAAQTGNVYAMIAAAIMDFSLAGGREELTNATNKYNQAIADINNRLRDKSNEAAAAWESTKVWVQANNNNLRLKAGGEQVTATSVNAARQADVRNLSDVQQRVAEAEQRGAAFAAQAASGVAGTTGDIINSTINLRTALTADQRKRTVASTVFDTAQRQADILRTAVSGLDFTYSAGQFDYAKDISQMQDKDSLFFQAAKAMGVKGASTYGEVGYNSGKKLWTWANSDNSENIGFGTNQDAGNSYSSTNGLA